MSEQIKNINPWVEKLEQISIPDAAQQWSAMKVLLDTEMPVTKRKRPGIWFWLIILSLLICSLLFGIARLNKFEQKKNVLSGNQPGVKNDKIKEHSLIKPGDSVTENKTKEKENKNTTETPDAKIPAIDNSNKNKNLLSKTSDNSKNTVALRKTKMGNEKKVIGQNENNNSESVSLNPERKNISNKNNRNKKQDSYKIENKNENLSAKTLSANSIKKTTSSNYKKGTAKKEKTKTENNSGEIISSQSKKINSDNRKHNKTCNKRNSVAQINGKWKSINDEQLDKSKNLSSATNDSSGLVINNQPLNENKNSGQSLMKDSSAIAETISQLHSDSTKKTDTANKQLIKVNKTDSVNNKKKKNIMFAAGIGFNQSFPVSGQEVSNLNTNGGNNISADYIPTPFFRVSFKKIYVQIEAQINSPQYTKNLLAKSNPTINSTGSLVVITQDSGTIKKLYYFNIPISIHYSLFKNFYVGAGLQFSMLTNGVGSFQSMRDSSTNGHSTFLFTSSGTANLKSNSIFDDLKKNELRFLLDANYQWKNLILGGRYTRALGNFINEQISASQVTQASNSSLQLYLQYILWKNKKTGKSLSK